MNGFQMLEQLSEISFAIIFITSYDQYAIKAIRFSALDYLLKPVIREELVDAVAKVQSRKIFPSSEQFQMLLEKIQNKESGFTKIAIPTHDGCEMIPIDQIIRCEADDNYTYFHIRNGKRITASRTLKEVEEQLESFTSFLRVHHSYIVNLNEVTKYMRGEGGYLVMSDNSTVNVSRSRRSFTENLSSLTTDQLPNPVVNHSLKATNYSVTFDSKRDVRYVYYHFQHKSVVL